MQPNRPYRSSVLPYVRAVLRHWVALVGGAALSVAAVVLAAAGREVPSWVWGAAILGGFALANFLAFHDVSVAADLASLERSATDTAPSMTAAQLEVVAQFAKPNVVVEGHKRIDGERKIWGCEAVNLGPTDAADVELTLHLADGSESRDASPLLNGVEDSMGQPARPGSIVIEVGDLRSDAAAWGEDLHHAVVRFSDAQRLGRWERRYKYEDGRLIKTHDTRVPR